MTEVSKLPYERQTLSSIPTSADGNHISYYCRFILHRFSTTAGVGKLRARGGGRRSIFFKRDYRVRAVHAASAGVAEVCAERDSRIIFYRSSKRCRVCRCTVPCFEEVIFYGPSDAGMLSHCVLAYIL